MQQKAVTTSPVKASIDACQRKYTQVRLIKPKTYSNKFRIRTTEFCKTVG